MICKIGSATFYDAEDKDQFDKDHNYQEGCQLARTAGSCTLECDTHHAYITIPVILPEI